MVNASEYLSSKSKSSSPHFLIFALHVFFICSIIVMPWMILVFAPVETGSSLSSHRGIFGVIFQIKDSHLCNGIRLQW